MCQQLPLRSVSRKSTFEEVWLEVNIEDVATEALNGVIEGQDMYAFAVLDVRALVDVDEIAKLHAKVVTRNLVHLDLALLDIVRAQANEDSVSPLLTPIARHSRLSIHMCKFEICTYLTMIVSPRNSWRASIVAGLRVATTQMSEHDFYNS